jgi:hypothetical protein
MFSDVKYFQQRKMRELREILHVQESDVQTQKMVYAFKK